VGIYRGVNCDRGFTVDCPYILVGGLILRNMPPPKVFFIAASKRHADVYARENGLTKEKYRYVDSPERLRGFDRNGAVIVEVGPSYFPQSLDRIISMSEHKGFKWYMGESIVWPQGDVTGSIYFPFAHLPIYLPLPFIRFHDQLTEAVEVGHGVAVTADAFESATSEFVILKTPDSDARHLFDMKRLFKQVNVWPNERCVEGKVWLRVQ